jgi:large subunit ribosomal protein L3
VAIELLCRKIGMTRIFDEAGECIPVTVLEAGPNVVVQQKTPERDGYAALQVGFGDRSRKGVPKGRLGHFEKANVAPKRWLRECRVSAEELEAHAVGSELRADVFSPGQRVDAIGVSKGRGTAGTVKRHNFSVKKESHGTHEGFRRPGSIGAGSFPGRVVKGKRMYGHMGDEQVTQRNVEVVQVDAERNLLLVRGPVPGHIRAMVRLRPARVGTPTQA